MQVDHLFHATTNPDRHDVVVHGEKVGELRAAKVVHRPGGQLAVHAQTVGLNITAFIGGTEPNRLVIGVNPRITDVAQPGEVRLDGLCDLAFPRGERQTAFEAAAVGPNKLVGG